MLIEFSDKESCAKCIAAANKAKISAYFVWSNINKKFHKTRAFVPDNEWGKFSELFAAQFNYQMLI